MQKIKENHARLSKSNTRCYREWGSSNCNARELWKTLEIRRDFSNWIKSQINSLGLEENFDLITTRQKRRIANGGYKEVTEYILTLDTAKHIAMASRTKKGKEVRLYFIEVEKRYRGDYRIKELESQINSLKVEIYDKTRENAELKRAINRITKNAEKEKSLLPAKRGGNVAFLDYIRYEERLNQQFEAVIKAHADFKMMKDRFFKAYPELEEKIKDLKQEQFLLN